MTPDEAATPVHDALAIEWFARQLALLDETSEGAA